MTDCKLVQSVFIFAARAFFNPRQHPVFAPFSILRDLAIPGHFSGAPDCIYFVTLGVTFL
jgi:hypothetical protein